MLPLTWLFMLLLVPCRPIPNLSPSPQSDGLHILPPPGADDLPEVPTKALGPILARPVSSIREEQEEIKSRRSHAASIGRSPHPRRSKKIIHLRTPSAPSSRRQTSDDACSSPTSMHDSRKLAPSGEDIPFDNPCQIASLSLRHVPPPDPLQNPPATDSGSSHKPLVYRDGFMLNQSTPHLRKSTMRDEHTGRMVTVVRSDDDDLDDTRHSHHQPAGVDKNWRNLRGQTDRVLHTHNNVTIITLGDDSVI